MTRKHAEETKTRYRAYSYETALCDVEDIEASGKAMACDVLDEYAERCEVAAKQFRAMSALLRLREPDIRGAAGNLGAGGFCLPTEDFDPIARIAWSPFKPGDHEACDAEGCEGCEYDYPQNDRPESDCPGDCTICPIAQETNPCLKLESWRMTAGINKSKEAKHGGEYLCPDCWPSYEGGMPSGVALVPAIPRSEAIVCRVCGAVWAGAEA